MNKETLRMHLHAGLITEGEYTQKLREIADTNLVDHYCSVIESNNMDEETAYSYLEDEGVEEMVIDSIIDRCFPNKDSLNENFVGTPMVGDIFDRTKTDYEIAFEHYMNKDEVYGKEEISKILRENIDIPSELGNFFQNTPFTKENENYLHIDAFKHIENKIGRSLTPQEKSKTTRTINKIRGDFWRKGYKEESEKEDKTKRDRYRKNLLPLTIDNGKGTPDPTYYEFANTYHTTNQDGEVFTSHRDPKSGYTDYQLKDKWINTPVDKVTLEKYWRKRN